jgi:transcriptional regulator with XRE-family HTH domain
MASILALVVKHHRAIKGLSQEQLGEAIHVSASLIAMIETGRRIPKPDIARRLDELFGTGELIRDGATEARKGHQPDWFRPWPEVEAEATLLRWYEPNYIPGLLQTEAYARAVLNSGLLSPERAEEHVALRMARCAAVFERDDPPVSTFVVDEIALRRGDPAMLKEQLLHLLEVGERTGNFVHVIPASAGLHIGLCGPFVLAGLAGGETVGCVDDQLSARVTPDVSVTPDADVIAVLEHTWQAVCAVALPRDQSRDLILKLIDEL